ncbi:EIF2AK3 family protein [Megaselia abdita]
MKMNSDYLFISTIDGAISAFDVRNNGELKWTLKTGTPLISSNIHNLDLTESGKFVRMIPSLSGGIYKFDGDEIDTVPITTEDLLNSSHKFSDDLVVSGGKDKVVFGISKTSGHILYECSMQGCMNATKTDAIKPKSDEEIGDSYDKNDDDVLVITKETQTIRAIEARTGQERWNYSVGRLELEILKGLDCAPSEIKTDSEDWKIDIKVSVSDGIIWVFKKNDPLNLLWKYKFEHPIVSIWTTDNDKLKPVDLFNSSSWRWNNNREDGPSLYIGMYQKQLYIQESDDLRKSLTTSFFQLKRLHDSVVMEGNGNQVQDLLPKFSWESMVINNEYLLGELDQEEAANSALVPIDNDNKQIAAKSILYSSEYVNGHGFFLYSNSKIKRNKICSSNDSAEENETILSSQLMDSDNFAMIYLWWREISVFLVTLLMVRLLWSYSVMQREKEIVVIERRIPVPTAMEAIETITVENGKTVNNNSNDKSQFSFDSSDRDSFDFSSRFEVDFDFVQCLGKGGFGVVFEAKNKLDDCNYAVKRIALPNKKESRERVLREVKTLANCEHGNIVRYYNAWVEKPPTGWQEQKDSKWVQSLKNGLFESEFNCNYSTSNEYTNNTNSHYSKSRTSVSIDMHLNESNSLDCTNLSNSFEIEFVNSTEEQVTVSSMNLSNHSLVRPESSAANQSKVYLYIQMQLCEKKSLHDWLRENALQQRYCNRNTFSIFEQIVDAVEYVHKKNLIHRDLKPSNIFFSLDGKIKIGDFGLVTDMSDIPNLILACGDKTGLPQCGVHTQLVGTHLYMSPEQLKGLAYDYKVDIFSLGLILFELLVYFDTEMERVVTLKNARDTKFSGEFMKQFPSEGKLLNSMLSENPVSRPTATELRNEIDRLQKEGL